MGRNGRRESGCIKKFAFSLEESSSDSEDGDDEGGNKEQKDSEKSKAAENPKVVEKPEPERRQPKDWRKMFEKRCIDDNFEKARERYLLRQQARMGLAVQ